MWTRSLGRLLEMNKRELAIVSGTKVITINNILLALNTAFLRKETVSIENFGEFKVHKSNVKRVRDFKKKVFRDFDGTYTIKFKPCPVIRKMLNRKQPEDINAIKFG